MNILKMNSYVYFYIVYFIQVYTSYFIQVYTLFYFYFNYEIILLIINNRIYYVYKHYVEYISDINYWKRKINHKIEGER